MPDTVSSSTGLTTAWRRTLTIGNNYQISLNDVSIFELYTWQIVLDGDDLLTQPEVATRLKSSFVQDLLIVSSSYRQVTATYVSLLMEYHVVTRESVRRCRDLLWLV